MITVGSTNQPVLSSVPPPATISAPASRASAIAPAWVSNDDPSITAPMKFVKSRGSPIAIEGTSRSRLARISGHRFDGR